ncbi:BspA family leucine-rich repeat surface protein, partial [Mangrovimonas sp. DI 80]|uniref:BspA family leucine-rich repeat surface protein n=1 Tax=Mangrovimonas sp. DI 80 TaxID=1779330 RepID=UPI001558D356
LNAWDVSNVTNMSAMFSEASSFNQPINNWNVSNVTYIDWMFSEATNFNQPLNEWDTSSVADIKGVFKNATSFNQPLNNWDVSNIFFMNWVFSGATNFNQSLDNWDVSNVGYMSHMFSGATNFNQPLNNWQFEDIKTGGFDNFLNGSGLSTENYDLLLGSLVDIYMSNSMEEILDFGGLGLTYCNMEAHDYLTNTLGWNINDAGVSGTCNIISGGVFFDLDDDGCTESDIPADIFSIEIDNGIETYKRFIQSGEYTFAATE